MINPSELTKKYGANAPRYTSYPTAPHFHEGVNEAVYRRWLGALTDRDNLSLYLHVPYCRQLCWYCGCNTRATTKYRPVAQYRDVLKNEIALVKDAISASPVVQRVHWGGGSPTIMSGGDFLDTMNALRASFDFSENAEIAVEIDPRTLNESKAELLTTAGVTRASLGVQEFAPRVQDAINRRQSFAQVARATAMLRRAGVAALSFDLMYGLPHQTRADAENTARLTAELRPERVSVFGYAHVPWMKTHQKLIDDDALPGARERMAQAEAAAAVLTSAGYEQIGLDHFALKSDTLSVLANSGGLRRNFQGYTDDPAEALIGFGASAIGSLTQGYVQNIADARAYEAAVNDGRLPVARGVEISNEDRLRRTIIERLMCDYAVDLRAICREHDAAPDFFAAERDALAAFEEDGIVSVDGGVINVRSEFRPHVRTVCTVFDQYLKTGKARHSRVI